MHASIFLIALLALSSCGKKEDKKPDYGIHFSKLQEASRNTIKVGTVIYSRTSGKEISINEYTAKAFGDRVSRKEKSIVLKIDGDDIYTYEEVEDLESRRSIQKVVLSKLSDDELMKNLVDLKADVSSDENFFRASLAKDHSFTEDGVGLFYTQSLEFSIDLRAICNTKMVQRSSNIRGYVLQDYYNVEDLILESTSSCDTSPEALMTKEELKKIYLERVQFCDDRDPNEPHCESLMDMRYLLD